MDSAGSGKRKRNPKGMVIIFLDFKEFFNRRGIKKMLKMLAVGPIQYLVLKNMAASVPGTH
ncbi:MAG: hypothetical protein CSB33_03430 [Desulfobacterales bacterium]|nr:MAG: hypothetical protein CSB33_03430 [Desulfobacterales bacterium]